MPTIEAIKRDPATLLTAKALTRTFQESTGAHFLDSGGAYGRNWQRNQKLEGWEAFASRPDASIELMEWEDKPTEFCYASLDGWHYVMDRFKYSRKWQKRFNKFAEANNDSWLENMENYAIALTGDEDPTRKGRYGEDSWRVWNTYNDDTLLNETFLIYSITNVNDDDDDLFLLSYHGGCDVRGGYTSPIALLGKDEDWYQVQEVELSCSCEGEISIDFRAYDISVYDHKNGTDYYIDEVRCPACNKVEDLTAHAPYPYQ